MNIFEAWARACIPEAREIVRTVMKSRGSPLSTKEIFELAVQQEPQTRIQPPEFKPMFDKRGRAKPLVPAPPHPTHPVRSVKSVAVTLFYCLRGAADTSFQVLEDSCSSFTCSIEPG